MKTLGAAFLVFLISGCARPPLAANPSPSIESSAAAVVSPEASPSSAATGVPTIVPPPTPSHAPILAITSAAFHAGEVGVAYAAVTLQATGGVGTYTWSISAGSLPAGLTVSSDGTVSGTPTAAGTASFTVHVADQASGSAIVNRSIPVSKRLSAVSICPTTAPCGFEAGCTICGKFATQSGGVGPFKYSLAGLIPTGMGYTGLSLTGTVPPPPPPTNVPPPDRFSVVITDSLGANASITSQVFSFAHISLADDPAGLQKVGTPLTFRMSYTGGFGTPKPALVAGSLPKNSTWTVDAVNRWLVVSVPAQPPGVAVLSYKASFSLTDQAICGPVAGQLCTATGTLTFSV